MATPAFTPPGRFIPPPPEALAQQFPQLEILELLGQGGMGAVYKARQPKLDRLVALKVLPPEVGQDPSFTERFIREARALAKLSHQHIVTVYDFGQAGDLYYFVMEFVDGANLRHLVAERKLSPREALAIIPQLCEALQYAHDEGVVHRDIKPENILVDRRGRVKIADFGLAKLLKPGAEDPSGPPQPFALTGSRQVIGTPHYMAPEQMERPLSVDHRADIYSLGVVFYEMLTGELPLGRFAPPSAKVQIDVRLDEVVLHSLEKEPDRRYQQASEVKTDVETISRSAQPQAAAHPAYGDSPSATFADLGDAQGPDWNEDEAALGNPWAVLAAWKRGAARRAPLRLSSNGYVMVVTGLLFLAAVMLFVSYGLSRAPAPVVVTPSPPPPSPAPRFNPIQPSPTRWVFGPDGPRLSNEFASSLLGFGNQKIDQVNKILRTTYQEAQELQEQFTERRTDESGHLHVRVKPFPKQVEKLEDRLWAQLDAILNPQQQAIARYNLKLHPPKTDSGTIHLAERIRPGFFGWGEFGGQVEIWRVGSWYHWKAQTEGWTYASQAPELPEEYRPFLKMRAPGGGPEPEPSTNGNRSS